MADNPTLKLTHRDYKIVLEFQTSTAAEVWITPPKADKLLLEVPSDLKGNYGLFTFNVATEADVVSLRKHIHKFVDAHIEGKTLEQIEKAEAEQRLTLVSQWWEKE